MYAERLFPAPVALCAPNWVARYEPTSFQEYAFVPHGPVRQILTPLKTGEYADRLSLNKQTLKSIFDSRRIAEDRRLLMLALAMQESQTLSPGERDWTKDGNGDGSENYSIFNINKDFIKFVTGSSPPAVLPLVDNGPLINPVSVGFAVNTIDQALNRMTPTQFILFHSGGITAYKTIPPANIASAPEVKKHADAVKTIIDRMEKDATLRINRERIGISVPHH